MSALDALHATAFPLLMRVKDSFKGNRVPLHLVRGIQRWLLRPILGEWPRHPEVREVLLVCSTSLMAEYLAHVHELLAGDPRVRCHLLLRSFVPDRPGAREFILSRLPVPVIGLRQAYARRWDLIITADHVHTALVDRRDCPTLFVPHGIGPGKKNGGDSYLFGRYALDARGRVRYSRMFVESEESRELGISINPDLRDVIEVIGWLPTAKLLSLEARREEVRRRLGFSPADRVVFVLSAWGPEGLWQRMGDDVLAQARALGGRFRFILNAHPNEYRPRPPGERVWGEYLRTQREHGFVVREPDESWMPYMVAADVVLTDFTSLALDAAILGRPLVYVPFGDEVVDRRNVIWRLRELSPPLRPDASNLGDCLAAALTDYPLERLREIGREIDPYREQSRDRATRVIYELLRLEPPPSVSSTA